LGIGTRGQKNFYAGATRWSKKFEDRFRRLDTIPAVTDSQPPSHVAVAGTALTTYVARVKNF